MCALMTKFYILDNNACWNKSNAGIAIGELDLNEMAETQWSSKHLSSLSMYSFNNLLVRTELSW